MLLVQAIRNAREALTSAERSGSPDRPYDDEWHDIEEQIATEKLLHAWRITLGILDRLGTPSLLESARESYQRCRKNPLRTIIGPDGPVLTEPWVVSQLLDEIETLFVPEEPLKAVKADLLDVLRRSLNYILNMNIFTWRPCDESDVHDRIEEMLRCVYTAVRRKPPIPGSVKSFVPDTAVQDVGTLIDYKMVRRADVVAPIVDEILADLGGYQFEGYDALVFVIYDCGGHCRESDWQDQIAAARSRHDVRVVVLHGQEPSASDLAKKDQAKKGVAHPGPGAVGKKKAKGSRGRSR